MRVQNFLEIVPRRARLLALVAGCSVVLAGLVAAGWATVHGAGVQPVFLYGVAALVFGTMLATWILGAGFVFGDASRRSMRPVLWVLVVVLFPHLLGFLLYFVLRQPLASPCLRCGRSVASGRHFCSWCGAPQAGSTEPALPYDGSTER